MKFKFKGKLKGLDYINSLPEGMVKDNILSAVRMAVRDVEPSMSYKDVTMLPYLEFMDFLTQFNKHYDMKEKAVFLAKE